MTSLNFLNPLVYDVFDVAWDWHELKILYKIYFRFGFLPNFPDMKMRAEMPAERIDEKEVECLMGFVTECRSMMLEPEQLLTKIARYII